jgi:hypothetical protein
MGIVVQNPAGSSAGKQGAQGCRPSSVRKGRAYSEEMRLNKVWRRWGEGHNEMPHYLPQTEANRNIGQDQYRHRKQKDVVEKGHLDPAKEEALKQAEDK